MKESKKPLLNNQETKILTNLQLHAQSNRNLWLGITSWIYPRWRPTPPWTTTVQPMWHSSLQIYARWCPMATPTLPYSSWIKNPIAVTHNNWITRNSRSGQDDALCPPQTSPTIAGSRTPYLSPTIIGLRTS